jgi:hypothetical protein
LCIRDAEVIIIRRSIRNSILRTFLSQIVIFVVVAEMANGHSGYPLKWFKDLGPVV